MQQQQSIAVATNGPRTIIATDRPGPGGAHHCYQIVETATGAILGEVNLQLGPEKEAGVLGVQHVDLLAIVQHRLDCFQRGPFASPVNEVTCGFVSAAIASENTRTRRRELAGVEGTSLTAAGVEEMRAFARTLPAGQEVKPE